MQTIVITLKSQGGHSYAEDHTLFSVTLFHKLGKIFFFVISNTEDLLKIIKEGRSCWVGDTYPQYSSNFAISHICPTFSYMFLGKSKNSCDGGELTLTAMAGICISPRKDCKGHSWAHASRFHF